MNIEHHNHRRPFNIFIAIVLATTLVLRCMPVARHPSKGKSQESVAPDVAHSPDLQMPLAQEKQHLEEIDALIKTM